jgi:hypothetical protein
MAIKGFNKVKANLKKVERAVISGTGKQFRKDMEEVITKGKELSPVDTGTLRSSGRAEGPKVEGKKVLVEGSFGQGPSGKYALYVHEGVGTKSGRSGGMTINYKVGQPKFLEQPFKEKVVGFFKRVGAAVAKTIKKSVTARGK